jgi:preprotein translocase subunit SecY
MQGLPHGPLALYNFAVGGAISRAALLAVGAMTYFQACLFVWLARVAFPRLRRATDDAATRRSVVRVATVGLALVQSFGFARFLQKIPGAVTFPGVGFTTQTVLLLTAGAMAVGWLGELALGPRNASDADAALSDVPVVPALQAGTIVDTPRRAERQVEISSRRADER